jgi:MOSC domain-containing protein YiiM
LPEGEPTSAWETPPHLWRGLKSAGSMWHGTVVSLYITPRSAEPMVAVSEVRAFADRGLEGDRFFRASWSAANRADKAVTLIEEETLERVAAELGSDRLADKTRRNIVTRGVPLIDLLQREFVVGGVVMRGMRLFEPCGHLQRISKVPGIFNALKHRSGLKAAILTDGVIRVGDQVTLSEKQSALGRSV